MSKFKSITRFCVALVILLATLPLFSTNVSGVAISSYNGLGVIRDHSHYEGMRYLSEQGIEGYQFQDMSIGSEKPITRSYIAFVLTKVLDLEVPSKSEVTNYFQDVNPDHPYAASIAAVGQAGIVKESNGDFLPEQELTREQIASILVNAFQLENSGKTVEINLSNVNNTYKESVQILANLGITNQLEDFRPNESTTRGQLATFLYKSLIAIGELEAPSYYGSEWAKIGWVELTDWGAYDIVYPHVSGLGSKEAETKINDHLERTAARISFDYESSNSHILYLDYIIEEITKNHIIINKIHKETDDEIGYIMIHGHSMKFDLKTGELIHEHYEVLDEGMDL